MKRFLTLCLRSLVFTGIVLLYFTVMLLWTMISIYFLYKLDVDYAVFQVLLAIAFFIWLFVVILLTHFVALSIYPWFPFVATFCFTFPEDIGKKPVYKILLGKKNLGASAFGVLCIEAFIILLILLHFLLH